MSIIKRVVAFFLYFLLDEFDGTWSARAREKMGENAHAKAPAELRLERAVSKPPPEYTSGRRIPSVEEELQQPDWLYPL